MSTLVVLSTITLSLFVILYVAYFMGKFTTKKFNSSINRSSIFPDDLFEGATISLDKSVKYLYDVKTLAFDIPENTLTVKSINTFFIDENKLELINLSNKYILVVDEYENTIYFLQKVFDSYQNKEFIYQEDFIYDREGIKYEYKNSTGVIDTYLDNNKIYMNVLYRDLENKEDPEYLFLITKNKNSVYDFSTSLVEFYIGITVDLTQLFGEN